MKKFVAILFAVAMVCSTALPAAVSASAADTSSLAGTTINVYNWGEYIDPEVLTIFEKETGIDVIYEEFETNEILYPKISSGAIAYDVICPSDYMIQRMIKMICFRSIV